MTSRTVYQNSPQYQATVKKIKEFGTFEKGWGFGDGIVFDAVFLAKALELNEEAFRSGFSKTDAFPGPNGEIMVTIYDKNHYLEFTIEPDGSVTFIREDGDDEVDYQEDLPFLEVKEKIQEFYKQWNGPESSINADTTMNALKPIFTAILFLTITLFFSQVAHADSYTIPLTVDGKAITVTLIVNTESITASVESKAKITVGDPVLVEQPIITQTLSAGCIHALAGYYERITPQLVDWNDEYAIIDSVPRSDMLDQIRKLMAVKHKFDAQAVDTCSSFFKKATSGYMSEIISGYLSLYGYDTKSTEAHFAKAAAFTRQIEYYQHLIGY